MPRDAVSRTANVERTGRHKWIKASYIPAGFNLETIEVVRFFNPPLEPFIKQGLMEESISDHPKSNGSSERFTTSKFSYRDIQFQPEYLQYLTGTVNTSVECNSTDWFETECKQNKQKNSFTKNSCWDIIFLYFLPIFGPKTLNKIYWRCTLFDNKNSTFIASYRNKFRTRNK